MRLATKCVILVFAIILVANLATATQMERHGPEAEANPFWRWVWVLTGNAPAFLAVSLTITTAFLAILLKSRVLETIELQMISLGIASLSAANDLLSLLSGFSPLILLVPPLAAVGVIFCWNKFAKLGVRARQFPLFTLAAYGAFFLIIIIGTLIPSSEEWVQPPEKFSPPAHIVEWLENRGFSILTTEDWLYASDLQMYVWVEFDEGVKNVGASMFVRLEDTVIYSMELRRKFGSWSDFTEAYEENAIFPSPEENLKVL
ncbi:MAG: hypothetical protein HWN68_10780 [Desulfobacterales bacterium]|nr:hypothetical protein [Desulfobacterales bacterium]